MDDHSAPILKALAVRPTVAGVERELGLLVVTATLTLVLGLRELQAAIVGVFLLWGGAALTAYDPDLLRILKRLSRQADLFVPY